MYAKRLKVCLSIGLFLIFLSSLASADIYRYRDENGVWHFTNIKSDKRYRLYIRSYTAKPSAYIKKYGSIIEQASERFKIEPSLVKAVIKAESDFQNRAVSHKGAKGLMQLMPKTANDMEVDDLFNPEENIFGGVRYLSILLERFQNNMRLALAAYNAGPEKVDAYNGVPPFPETKDFIRKVLDYYNQYKSVTK